MGDDRSLFLPVAFAVIVAVVVGCAVVTTSSVVVIDCVDAPLSSELDPFNIVVC